MTIKDEPAVIPQHLRLRLEKCPMCTYERHEEDDAFSSPFECPKCGVVYAVAMEEVRRLNQGQQLQDEAELAEMRRRAQAQDPSLGGSQLGGAMFVNRAGSATWVAVGVGLLALGVAALFFFL